MVWYEAYDLFENCNRLPGYTSRNTKHTQHTYAQKTQLSAHEL